MLTLQRHSQIRFVFASDVPMDEVEGTLVLAQIAAESLYGRGRVEIEAPWVTDKIERSVLIDAMMESGRTLTLVFQGYLQREFGLDAFEMTCVTPDEPSDRDKVDA